MSRLRKEAQALMRRHTALVAAVALVATLISSCGSTEPRQLLGSIRSGTVILGTKFDQPGVGLQHPDKKMSGFDVKISEYVVNAIADELGVAHPAIRWYETPSAQREQLIDNGTVDMIAGSYSVNYSRAQKVSFAGPYLITYQGLLVRKADNSLTTLDDLNRGKKLCSVSGSTPAQNVKNLLAGTQLQEFDSYSSCVEALRRGKVDALTTDETILAGYAKRYEGEFKLIQMNYELSKPLCIGKPKKQKKNGDPFSREVYGIGLAKGDTAAVEAIDRALDKMIASGTWDADLRDALGNSTIDDWEKRATSGTYGLLPDPSPAAIEKITGVKPVADKACEAA
ncbi:glutamate ABC transporter substrate-binding protein [Mycobacteroides salmoniphilum]|uniref:ABC transporter glutamine-binding protein GlnH n=1 Tax=Mycobacteroides salmoniphilum TaxID=404941 RepID=A0A4R8SPW9_9MYCO|nr:glutamate ABC transporter substrate-binding protein [Mycobacteroides salmoniphilum]TDZ91269.1 ABC transporter glutamine-binding protein GlnH precursor [Mycobacteroides salmoniphilum]TEA01145.1 ABC transporter glutamine-binding protein GlnH precursor [Mycobacteroides salmoniphilum]